MNYKKVHIVIGTGFGDEGKGATVNFLCETSLGKPIVVRFNGGHQAGHTVRKDNVSHVFSNFGAGTLQSVPTFWSKYCTFCPASMLKEYDVLVDLSTKTNGFNIRLYVDNLCPVVTHYDVFANRHYESINKHGSCGVGFGTTVKRNETPYKLYAQDLLFPDVVREKLKAIRKYYKELVFDYNVEEADESFINNVLVRLKDLVNNSKVTFTTERSAFFTSTHIIFEGAQGILLDQDFGFFPHVTRSNTTSKNAMKIIKRNFDKKVKILIHYVTRCYQTRHGNGPMSNENLDIELKNNENETNVLNKYQGGFRTAVLDLDLLYYALKCDSQYTDTEYVYKTLVITCTDQMIDKFNIPYTLNNKVHTGHIMDICSKFKNRITEFLELNRKIYINAQDISLWLKAK